VILFCDTSALIKLLIDEPGSDRMHQASQEAEAIAVCRITWAEAMAAMERRQRDDPISSDAIDQARELLMAWQMPSLCVPTTACSSRPPLNCTGVQANHWLSPASTGASTRRPGSCNWRCWPEQHTTASTRCKG
jgi:hypothetical protein